jgi:phosphoglycolate phosphatase
VIPLLFIFDWDGTLSDSTGNITRAMQMAVEGLGWAPIEGHRVHNIIGLGLPEAIARLYPDASEKDRARLRDGYRANFVVLDERQPAGLFAGVQETLERLREEGHNLTIATGKSRAGLDRILNNLGLNHFFHGTRCADETRSKPHPLMLEQLLLEFACSAEVAVMIGDTEYDMEMARRVGMPRIAVSYGAHAVERLKIYDPELCLDRFDQLLSWHRLA